MKRFPSKTAQGALVAAAVGVLISGCGGNGSAAPAAAATIKLMTIAPVSTNLQNYPDAEAGARAAVEAINAKGGIKGKKIEWSFCNTESDPNKAAACARKAEKDGVVAIAGQVDVFSTNTLPILEKAGIASVGFQSFGNKADWTSKISFPLQGGAPASYVAAANGIKQSGGKRVAIVYTDVPASVNEAAMIEQSISREGLTLAGKVPVPPSGITDYAPYAQKIADNKADAVVLITSAAFTGPLIKAASGLGITPLWVHNAFSFGEAEMTALGEQSKGMITISPYPTFRDTSNAGIVEFNKELDAAGVAADPILRRPAGLNAWLSVHALSDVIGAMDGEITNATVVNALGSHGDIDLYGITTWNPSKLGAANPEFARFPSAEQRFLTLENGKLVTAPLKTVTDSILDIKSGG